MYVIRMYNSYCTGNSIKHFSPEKETLYEYFISQERIKIKS